VINESGLINDPFIIASTEVENGQDTTDGGSLSVAHVVKTAQEYIAKLTAEIFALAKERDEARRECDEVVAACRGTQMDEAAIASMWQYVREKVAIQSERDALAERVREMEMARDAARLAEQDTKSLLMQWALEQYANSINWMPHTDQNQAQKVWLGSTDGPEYARRALGYGHYGSAIADGEKLANPDQSGHSNEKAPAGAEASTLPNSLQEN